MTLRYLGLSHCHRGPVHPFAPPGTERRFERPRPFRLLHLDLDLDLDVDHRRVTGSAHLSFERVDRAARQLHLDAIGFEIRAVRLHTGDQSRAARFDYDGDELCIDVPLELNTGRVTIEYSAVPRRGLYFLEPDANAPSRPRQVWSQCQDEDARHWFPCHDAPHVKLTSELRIRVPENWMALSNGICLEANRRDPRTGRAHFHYRLDQPHPSYLVALVAGEFAVVSDRSARLSDGREIPVRYYVPVGSESDARRGLSDTPRMIEWFSRKTGIDYPFPSYSQVVIHDFFFGGMENTTLTTLYEHVLLDETAALDVRTQDLVAHELAHQWFGDLVTCREWSEAWLNEGFATFFEHAEREERLGRDAYDWGILSDLSRYLSEAQGDYARPVVCREYPHPILLFDRHLYEKGGLVLHMLRRELGEEAFFAGIRRYLSAHRFGIVETRDLQHALEAEGRSLGRFFDDWLFRPDHPELDVKASWQAGQLVVELNQRCLSAPERHFSLPFEILVMTKAGELVRQRKQTQGPSDVHTLTLPEKPRWVAFDPDLRIAAAVKLEMGLDWLEALLREGPTYRSRAMAAECLGKRPELASVRALGEILHSETESFMLRSTCAAALGQLATTDSLDALVAASSTTQHDVRRAIAIALGQFRAPRAAQTLDALGRQDQSYLVRAEACRSLGRTRQPGLRATLEGLLNEPSWADVIRAGALDGLAALGDPEATGAVKACTLPQVPTRGRRAAVLALAKLSADRLTREYLATLLDEPDPLLRMDVVESLELCGDPGAGDALRKRLAREPDGRVRRRIEVGLAALSARDGNGVRRLTDEVEALRRRLGELESRLTRLEPQDPASTTRTKNGSSSPRPAKSRTVRRQPQRKDSSSSGGRRTPKGTTRLRTPRKG